MNTKREIVVSECVMVGDFCPFCQELFQGEFWCVARKPRKIQGDYDQDHPDCPLRAGPITVRLSKIVRVP